MKNDDIAKNSLKCAGKFITQNCIAFSKGAQCFHDGITRRNSQGKMSFRLTEYFRFLFDALLRSEYYIHKDIFVHTIKVLIFQKINKKIMTLTPGYNMA